MFTAMQTNIHISTLLTGHYSRSVVNRMPMKPPRTQDLLRCSYLKITLDKGKATR